VTVAGERRDGGLSPRWRAWIAENLARGVSEQRLAEVLGSRGLAEDRASSYVEEVAREPATAVARQLADRLEKLQAQLDVYESLHALVEPAGQLRRERAPAPEDFLERFYSANRPVVIEGLMDGWAAVRKWTPEYLRTTYGDREVLAETDRSTEPPWRVFLKGQAKPWRFGDYVDAVVAAGSTNKLYMTASDRLFWQPGMTSLLDDIEVFPGYLDPDGLERRISFWFGPKGTISPLHRDDVNVLFAQVRGRKRVRLVSSAQLHRVYNERSFYSQVDLDSPDPERFPLFDGVRVLETEVGPGDVLFIPVGWWHHVTALDVSISVAMTNFVWPNPRVERTNE
jgi:hypothetical protein